MPSQGGSVSLAIKSNCRPGPSCHTNATLQATWPSRRVGLVCCRMTDGGLVIGRGDATRPLVLQHLADLFGEILEPVRLADHADNPFVVLRSQVFAQVTTDRENAQPFVDGQPEVPPREHPWLFARTAISNRRNPTSESLVSLAAPGRGDHENAGCFRFTRVGRAPGPAWKLGDRLEKVMKALRNGDETPASEEATGRSPPPQ